MIYLYDEPNCAKRGDMTDHITVEQLQSILFPQSSDHAETLRLRAHVNNCEECTDLIERERERNELFRAGINPFEP